MIRARLSLPVQKSIQSGHPWIFHDAIQHPKASDGDIVEIYDADDAFVGRGVLEPSSELRARIWTTDDSQVVDDTLAIDRLAQARKRRIYPTQDTDGYRLLHGESDRFPAVVCDIYRDVAVIRIDGQAADRWLEPVAEHVMRWCKIRDVAIRRSRSHQDARAQWLRGGRQTVEFLENGLTFLCDPIEGQKTGFFLDQRENRLWLAQRCQGKRLLNLFGYTGGFSVFAAAHGATWTHTVDLAEPALEMAKEIFRRNAMVAEAHYFEKADVFAWLEAQADASAPYEVVVCDPPSFAHRRRDVPDAMEAYRHLFSEVFRVMPEGSTVALSSCSSHIDRQRFLTIIARAAEVAGIRWVLTRLSGAGDDHPILPGFPEGEYLQFAAGTIHRAH